jgi:hypothetical protein
VHRELLPAPSRCRQPTVGALLARSRSKWAQGTETPRAVHLPKCAAPHRGLRLRLGRSGVHAQTSPAAPIWRLQGRTARSRWGPKGGSGPTPQRFEASSDKKAPGMRGQVLEKRMCWISLGTMPRCRQLRERHRRRQAPTVRCLPIHASTRSPPKASGSANGRCRLHGGLSTGPKTAAGKRRLTANRPTISTDDTCQGECGCHEKPFVSGDSRGGL